MIDTHFKSVRELIAAFPTEQSCIDHLEWRRWKGTVVSPYDPASTVYKCRNNQYKCRNAGKYFNVRTQSLFDNSKVELRTWFLAIYLVTAHKKGISSVQLGRDLNVTQKTAWFMLHRIRNCFGLADNGVADTKIGGGGTMVEVDETYVGGKAINKSNKQRKALKEGTGYVNKTPIVAMIERGGKIVAKAFPGKNKVTGEDLKPVIREKVETDTVIVTDGFGAYAGLAKEYVAHEVVNHAASEYARGPYHTNTVEGFFSILDRGYIGIYHYMSDKHLSKYLDEFLFRYNTRKIDECDRFNMLLSNTTKRLNYQTLIAKNKANANPQN